MAHTLILLLLSTGYKKPARMPAFLSCCPDDRTSPTSVSRAANGSPELFWEGVSVEVARGAHVNEQQALFWEATSVAADSSLQPALHNKAEADSENPPAPAVVSSAVH